MEINKIGIIGLGLIGGSIAKALKKADQNIIINVIDVDRQSLNEAFKDKIADNISTDDYSIIKGCQVIFICAPVKVSISAIEKIAPYVNKETIITDVCSTKTEIISAASKFKNITFIGGHPMTGSEKIGYQASNPHLFENAYYIMCPLDNTDDSKTEMLKNIILSIGGIPIRMTPENHDFVTGSISHLPHVVASCLVNYVADNDVDNSMKQLAAGGFRDITRIASSSPVMWQNICLSNKEPILDILDKFTHILSEFRDKLAKDDFDYIYNYFNNAKLCRDSMIVTRKSNIPLYFELIADIPDIPGVLGDIATLLGKHGINIKNMNISNSREFEGGCLTVSFPDSLSRDTAIEILTSNNIRCYAK